MVQHLEELPVAEPLVEVDLLEGLRGCLDVHGDRDIRVVALQINLPQLLLPKLGRVEELELPRVVEVVVGLDCGEAKLLPDLNPDALLVRPRALIEHRHEVSCACRFSHAELHEVRLQKLLEILAVHITHIKVE